jgi:hypothetical protein
MLGAMVNQIASELGNQSEEILVMKMEFRTTLSDITGQLCFLFDPEATSKLLAAGRGQMPVGGQASG